MLKSSFLLMGGLLSIGAMLHGQTPAVKRPFRPGDIYRLPVVSDPQVSPDGKWVSYTLTTIDSLKDGRNADIWMVSTDGSQDIQLTSSPDGESRARWSPDGKWISFLSSRGEVKGSQVWLMDRRGGEGKRLTEIKGGVSDYAWSPDSRRLLLTLTDPDAEDTGKIKTVKPYVIDRYQYKEDVSGYRYKKQHTHLYLFDVVSHKLDTLTRGNYDEESAVWSPDGTQIAFVSNRTADPDQNENTDIWIIAASPVMMTSAQPGGGTAGQARGGMRQLTTWKGSDNSPRWSPDGSMIAYTRSLSDEDYHMYDEPVLCVVAAAGGEPRLLSRALDRPVFNPRWAPDGKTIWALVEDDMQQTVSLFPVSGAKPEISMFLEGSVSTALETSGDTRVVLNSNPQHPAEIYSLKIRDERRFVSSTAYLLTHHTDSFLAPLKLADVKVFQSESADGTKVSGYYYRPDPADKKLPLILYIHGGPVSQDALGFDLTRQILAGGGYVVAAVNYRGSSGRGVEYSKTISADWGNKEVMDLHGAVDWLVNQGIVDSSRMGVAGWS